MSFSNRVATIATLTLAAAALFGIGSPGFAQEIDRAINAPVAAQVPQAPAMIPAIAQVDLQNEAQASDDVQDGDTVEYGSLAAAVAAQSASDAMNDDLSCMAGAIYFESKGEPLSFLEVAAAHGGKAEAAAMIEEALAKQPEMEIRTELRRRQLGLIENDPVKSTEFEAQLKALINEDPARADEYRIRLALQYAREKRTDQAALILRGGNRNEPLGAIDLNKIADAALLTGLEGILRESGSGPKNHVAILERLIALEPGNRGAWARWISELAASSDEDRLRTALRRLLAGVGKLEFGTETRQLMEHHLLASYWRSLHRLLRDAEENQARLAESLPLLDAADRLAKNHDEWLWLAWTRAYALNRLGRHEARDSTIREFDRIAALAPLPKPKVANAPGDVPEDDAPREDSITFPDGLVIGIREAHVLLTASPTKVIPRANEDSAGPRGALRVRWAFDTERSAAITKILPMENGRVVVLDGAGRVYSIDGMNGKLLWSREGPRPARPMPDENGNYGGGAIIQSLAVPVADGARIFLPSENGIECWSADDGRVLWRALSLRGTGTKATVHPILFIHAGHLLVCDAATASLSALDLATGKLIWHREYQTAAATTQMNPLNTGASLSNGRLLFYGHGAFIVNADDGALLWSFDAKRVREFPIALSDPLAASTPQIVVGGFNGRRSSRSSRGFGGSSQTQSLQVDYLQNANFRGPNSYGMPMGTQFRLTNAAATWASGDPNSGQGRLGILDGDRMMLLNGSTLNTVRLDLPFGGGFRNANGTFVGISGHRVCMLNNDMLQLCDTESSAVSNIQISEPQTEGTPNAPRQAAPISVQAAMDGPLIHVSGPDGIATYHARTGNRIQRSPWPANVAPPPQPASAYGAQYFPQGWYTHDPNRRAGAIETLTATVRDGVLYTPVTASRLVALVGLEKARAQ